MNRRTKLAIARDKNIKAKHGGKRISAEGNVYYENRENRSDVNRTKKFGKGGDLWTPLDFTSIEEYFDYINDSLINGNRTQVKNLYNDMDESQKRQFFRYAAMQEGSFNEVVDYINEYVREYKNGGSIGYKRVIDPVTKKIKIVGNKPEKIEKPKVTHEVMFKSNHNNDKSPVRFSRKFAKGDSVTIGEYKATFKVKYALDGGKLKDGYVVSVLTPSEHEVDYYNLYDSKKNLVKKLSPQEAQQLVKDKKITFVKRYDVPNEKQKSSPDTEVKDMSYAERQQWIKENIVPNLKSAVNYWNSYNHGSFDSNDEKSKKEFLDKVRKSAMYGSTEEFEKATSLKVDDSGWGLQSPEGEEFEQVASDNTYNSSYLGLFDWNFRIYSIYDERFVLIAHPHMGGDVRGNYGDPIFLEGESKEDVLMKFYEEVIDGKHSVNLEFKDGTSVTFDAQQDSDVNYYELYDDGSKKKIKLGSPVEVLTTTFKTFGGWKGDDFVEEIVDEFERSKEKKAKKMADGGGIEDKFKVGDLVFNKTLGSRGLVGLVISEGKENEEYETFEYDVLYRGYGGDVIPTEESEIVDITEGYIDFAEGNGDLMHYPNISKKHGITLNPKYQEAIDESLDEDNFDNEDEFKRGGAIKQRGAQYERDVPYGSRDTSVRARPVGYRYRKIVDKKTGRLRKIEKTDKEYYQPVTQKDIKAYEEMDKNARRRIYLEKRADHSDKNPKNKRAY